MAYITSWLTTTAAGASFSPAIPAAYAANDLLLCLLENDSGITVISTASPGWAVHSQLVSGNSRTAVAWKVAGASEAAPSFAGSNATWHGTMIVIRDAPATSPISGITLAAFTGVNTANSGALNTGADNGCLLVYATGVDQGYSRYSSNDVVEVEKVYDTNSQMSLTCGYRMQVSGGACPVIASYYSGASITGVTAVIAIKNASGGVFSPDCRDDSTPVKWYGNFGTQAQPIAGWVSANAFVDPGSTGVQIGPLNLLIDTATASQNNNVGITGHWGNFTRLTSSTIIANPGKFAGAAHAIASTDFTGKIFTVQMSASNLSDSFVGTEGFVLALSDSGGNWAAYQVAQRNKLAAGVVTTYHIDVATAAKYDESASPLNIADVTGITYWCHRQGNTGSTMSWDLKNACLLGTAKITGGGASYPASFRVASQCLEGWGNYRTFQRQAAGQFMAKSNIQIGDGAIATYFKLPPQSLSYPETYTPNAQPYQYYWNCGVGAVTLSVYASAADTIRLVSGVAATSTDENFTINAASSASAAYDFSGFALVGYTPTWSTGIACNGASFTACDTAAFKGSNVTGCSLSETISANAVCSFDAAGAVVSATTITATPATAYHMELGAAVTAITLNDVTFAGTAGTNKIHVLATTGTVTINVGGTTSLVPGSVTSAGATVSIVSSVAITFAGLVAGSKVKAFTTGTTTEVFGVTGSGTSEVWSAASGTFDYTVQQAGYKPIRVAGEVVSGSRTITIAQEVDRAYAASSGLTLGTNCYATVGTKLFGLTVASTLQNFYCYMIEQWIALGDGGEALANVAFPIQPNGPSSFSFLAGWEWDLETYSASITNLSRDGLRYVNTGGNTTAQWAAILTSGVPAGARVRYQQTDGGTTQQAAIASGNMDELVKVYGDATHGNFDYRAYLALKVQEMGYDQAEADAVGLYGNLEDQLYVVGLAPTANTVATGNPALANPPTITDHGASPVTWQTKAWSITITDSAAGNSGTNIMRWLRYYFETGGTFQGKNAFCWHDLVQQNGSSFKTVRGKLYGDTGATLKGVRVVKSDGTAPHADFDLMTADDGTTYQPPQQANITWASALDGTTVIVYNDSQAGYMLDGGSTVSGGGGYSLPITLPHAHVAAGDTIRLRHCKIDKYADEIVGTMTATGLALLGAQVAHAEYATWGIDGSTVTEFSADQTNIDVDISGAITATTKKRLGAWFQYLLTLPAGLNAFYGAFVFESANSIRQDVSVVDVVLQKTSAGPVQFTDNDVRYYRSNFSLPYDPTGNAIYMDYAGVPFVVSTGGSALTVAENAKLMGLPDAATTANTVLAAAQDTPIHADARKMNGATIGGTGTAGDQWRGA